MPTYEYRCSDCGYEFEQFQSISDAPILVCPECGGKTERVISGGAGLIFKGSGFYITDHRNSQYKSDAAKDTSSKSEAITKTPDKPKNDSGSPK